MAFIKNSKGEFVKKGGPLDDVSGGTVGQASTPPRDTSNDLRLQREQRGIDEYRAEVAANPLTEEQERQRIRDDQARSEAVRAASAERTSAGSDRADAATRESGNTSATTIRRGGQSAAQILSGASTARALRDLGLLQ